MWARPCWALCRNTVRVPPSVAPCPRLPCGLSPSTGARTRCAPAAAAASEPPQQRPAAAPRKARTWCPACDTPVPSLIAAASYGCTVIFMRNAPPHARLSFSAQRAPRRGKLLSGLPVTLHLCPSQALCAPRCGKLLDVAAERFPEHDRRVISSLIIQGKLLVNDAPVFKAGTLVSASADLRIKGAAACRFASRAGLKLDAALEHFNVGVEGRTALDAGLSTGGFADCLLQRGASRVYGVDVGNAQVADALRREPRLAVMERTNLRHMTPADLPPLTPGTLAARPDLITLDLSFISVLTVLPAVAGLMAPAADLVSLIKPQFEARREQVEEGGVVTDSAVHEEVVARVTAGIEALGFKSHGIFESPVRGAVGKNVEFFIHASRTEAS